MNYSEIMVRYGELSTKGKNRKVFINQLSQNVKQALRHKEVKVQAFRDRMHLILNGAPAESVIEDLQSIFGIQSFSPVVKIEKTTTALIEAAVEMMTEVYEKGTTFKIVTKRADHHFEWTTNDINQNVGNAIFDAIDYAQVSMKEPDLTLRIEVRQDGIYLMSKVIKGMGGLPVGSSGKGMLMLSGGIDSPVAGYLAMKRGVKIEAVHFASPPYTSPQALLKTKQLTAKLAPYVGNINFLEVPFTEIQEEIKRVVPEGYLMTVTRRMMMRLCDAIREQRKGLAIINGESLGQVASQTMHSMLAINDVTTTPVLRPVITMDKLEIIDIAQQIDTYELSIQPFEDCCTIFTPPAPKTRPKIEKAREYEARLDVDGLIQRSLDGVRVTKITANFDESVEEVVYNLAGEVVMETTIETRNDLDDLL